MIIRSERFSLSIDETIRHTMRRQRPIFGLIFGLYGLFVGTLIVALDFPLGLGIALGIAVTAAQFLLKPFELRRRFALPAYRATLQTRVIELEDGVLKQIAEDGARSEIPLTSFLRFERALDSYLLFLTPDYYFAIPKRAFPDPAERRRFEDALLATIPNPSSPR